MSDTAIAEVKAAADYLIERFGAFDRDAYFACFTPEASFLFHTTDRLLAPRAAYQEEWQRGSKSGSRCSPVPHTISASTWSPMTSRCSRIGC